MPLTRSFDLFQSCLLEASAGTGKTYTITHLFVRFLLQKMPIEKILVVTFTKAAVAELKGRIRKQIKDTLLLLESGDVKPEYLEELDEEEAKKLLQKALLSFEEAVIMTIHAFCARMLASSGLMGIIEENGELLFESRLQFLLEDVLYTGLEEPGLSGADIAPLGNQIERLEALSSRHLKDSKRVEHNFQGLEKLYTNNGPLIEHLVKGQNIRKAFEDISPYYNGIKNSTAALDNLEDIALCGITYAKFVKLLYNAAPFTSIREDNRNKRRKEAPSSPLFEKLSHLLQKIARHNNMREVMAAILGVVQDIKIKAPHHFKSPDDVLKNMLSALKIPYFLENIRASFDVAIIDEFQDTDPLQWQIFSSCFFPDKPCFLVGDPKQSIYSFRKADVYTYLHAASLTGKKVILNTNWRSTPELVGAFNALFSAKSWLFLPKVDSFLEAPSLIAGQKSASLEDGKGAVHFLLLESSRGSKSQSLSGKLSKSTQEVLFFEEIAAEISQLNIPLTDIAILVSDRGQAKRLESLLKKKGLLTANWQRLHKDDDEQDLTFRLFLEALLKPQESGLIKAALMTPLFRFTLDMILSDAFAKARDEFFYLNELWAQKGFAFCLSHLFSSTRLSIKGTLAENLDSFREGQKLLLEIKRQAEDLLEEDWMRYPHLPEQVLSNYDKRSSAPRKGLEGVNILTTHASKGLEFSVVFALSLAFGSYKAEEFFSSGDKIAWADKDSPHYSLFLEEKDAEKLRQLYVAMTRAKKRLYLPYTLTEKEAASGKASPLDLFIKSQCDGDICAYLESLKEKASITYAFIKERSEEVVMNMEKSASLLEIPPLVLSQSPLRRMLSFTALSKKGESEPVPHKEGLPSGAIVGEILHRILELMPWDRGQSLEMMSDFIRPFLKGTLLEDWQEKVASMIFAVLHMPLKDFCLMDVNPQKVMREMEFLHKTPAHYLKGFIDMAFE
ncbi:MAG: UvrD-helicase domain-containing protein, partial [Chlamydiota bacterium]